MVEIGIAPGGGKIALVTQHEWSLLKYPPQYIDRYIAVEERLTGLIPEYDWIVRCPIPFEDPFDMAYTLACRTKGPRKLGACIRISKELVESISDDNLSMIAMEITRHLLSIDATVVFPALEMRIAVITQNDGTRFTRIDRVYRGSTLLVDYTIPKFTPVESGLVRQVR